MKLSFNTWVYGSFPLWLPTFPLEYVIDELALIGYDGVEIGAAAPHAYPAYLDGPRRHAIGEQLRDRGLEVSALCPAVGGGPGFNPVSPDEPERLAAIEYFGSCIDLAADLGCQKMIWLGGHRRYGQHPSDAWSLGVDSLRQVAQTARQRSVSLVVEPTPADSNVLNDVGDCLRLIEDADVDAGVLVDTYHVFHRNDEIRAPLREAGDRLAYVHLADLGRDAPGTHHDFGTVVQELHAIGYDGWLSMEVGFNRRESDPAAVARTALAHIRSLIRN
jgi:protein FrlC